MSHSSALSKQTSRRLRPIHHRANNLIWASHMRQAINPVPTGLLTAQRTITDTNFIIHTATDTLEPEKLAGRDAAGGQNPSHDVTAAQALWRDDKYATYPRTPLAPNKQKIFVYKKVPKYSSGELIFRVKKAFRTTLNQSCTLSRPSTPEEAYRENPEESEGLLDDDAVHIRQPEVLRCYSLHKTWDNLGIVQGTFTSGEIHLLLFSINFIVFKLGSLLQRLLIALQRNLEAQPRSVNQGTTIQLHQATPDIKPTTIVPTPSKPSRGSSSTSPKDNVNPLALYAGNGNSQYHYPPGSGPQQSLLENAGDLTQHSTTHRVGLHVLLQRCAQVEHTPIRPPILYTRCTVKPSHHHHSKHLHKAASQANLYSIHHSELGRRKPYVQHEPQPAPKSTVSQEHQVVVQKPPTTATAARTAASPGHHPIRKTLGRVPTHLPGRYCSTADFVPSMQATHPTLYTGRAPRHHEASLNKLSCTSLYETNLKTSNKSTTPGIVPKDYNTTTPPTAEAERSQLANAKQGIDIGRHEARVGAFSTTAAKYVGRSFASGRRAARSLLPWVCRTRDPNKPVEKHPMALNRLAEMSGSEQSHAHNLGATLTEDTQDCCHITTCSDTGHIRDKVYRQQNSAPSTVKARGTAQLQLPKFGGRPHEDPTAFTRECKWVVLLNKALAMEAKQVQVASTSGVKCQIALTDLISQSKNAKIEKQEFVLSTIRTFIEANIPLEKIDHPKLREWINKYIPAFKCTLHKLSLRWAKCVDQMEKLIAEDWEKEVHEATDIPPVIISLDLDLDTTDEDDLGSGDEVLAVPLTEVSCCSTAQKVLDGQWGNIAAISWPRADLATQHSLPAMAPFCPVQHWHSAELRHVLAVVLSPLCICVDAKLKVSISAKANSEMQREYLSLKVKSFMNDESYGLVIRSAQSTQRRQLIGSGEITNVAFNNYFQRAYLLFSSTQAVKSKIGSKRKKGECCVPTHHSGDASCVCAAPHHLAASVEDGDAASGPASALTNRAAQWPHSKVIGSHTASAPEVAAAPPGQEPAYSPAVAHCKTPHCTLTTSGTSSVEKQIHNQDKGADGKIAGFTAVVGGANEQNRAAQSRSARRITGSGVRPASCLAARHTTLRSSLLAPCLTLNGIERFPTCGLIRSFGTVWVAKTITGCEFPNQGQAVAPKQIPPPAPRCSEKTAGTTRKGRRTPYIARQRIHCGREGGRVTSLRCEAGAADGLLALSVEGGGDDTPPSFTTPRIDMSGRPPGLWQTGISVYEMARAHLCHLVPFPEVSDTVENISKFLATVLQKWGLGQKVVAVVRDNARNIVVGIQLTPFNHTTSLAHTLQLVLKEGFLSNKIINNLSLFMQEISGSLQAHLNMCNLTHPYLRTSIHPSIYPSIHPSAAGPVKTPVHNARKVGKSVRTVPSTPVEFHPEKWTPSITAVSWRSPADRRYSHQRLHTTGRTPRANSARLSAPPEPAPQQTAAIAHADHGSQRPTMTDVIAVQPPVSDQLIAEAILTPDHDNNLAPQPKLNAEAAVFQYPGYRSTDGHTQKEQDEPRELSCGIFFYNLNVVSTCKVPNNCGLSMINRSENGSRETCPGDDRASRKQSHHQDSNKASAERAAILNDVMDLIRQHSIQQTIALSPAATHLPYPSHNGAIQGDSMAAIRQVPVAMTLEHTSQEMGAPHWKPKLSLPLLFLGTTESEIGICSCVSKQDSELFNFFFCREQVKEHLDATCVMNGLHPIPTVRKEGVPVEQGSKTVPAYTGGFHLIRTKSPTSLCSLDYLTKSGVLLVRESSISSQRSAMISSSSDVGHRGRAIFSTREYAFLQPQGRASVAAGEGPVTSLRQTMHLISTNQQQAKLKFSIKMETARIATPVITSSAHSSELTRLTSLQLSSTRCSDTDQLARKPSHIVASLHSQRPPLRNLPADICATDQELECIHYVLTSINGIKFGSAFKPIPVVSLSLPWVTCSTLGESHPKAAYSDLGTGVHPMYNTNLVGQRLGTKSGSTTFIRWGAGLGCSATGQRDGWVCACSLLISATIVALDWGVIGSSTEVGCGSGVLSCLMLKSASCTIGWYPSATLVGGSNKSMGMTVGAGMVRHLHSAACSRGLSKPNPLGRMRSPWRNLAIALAFLARLSTPPLRIASLSTTLPGKDSMGCGVMVAGTSRCCPTGVDFPAQDAAFSAPLGSDERTGGIPRLVRRESSDHWSPRRSSPRHHKGSNEVGVDFEPVSQLPEDDILVELCIRKAKTLSPAESSRSDDAGKELGVKVKRIGLSVRDRTYLSVVTVDGRWFFRRLGAGEELPPRAEAIRAQERRYRTVAELTMEAGMHLLICSSAVPSFTGIVVGSRHHACGSSSWHTAVLAPNLLHGLGDSWGEIINYYWDVCHGPVGKTRLAGCGSGVTRGPAVRNAVPLMSSRHYNTEPSGHQSILRWYNKFQDTGCLGKGKSTGPQKSNRASRELGIPQQTVWEILRRRLQLKPYHLKLLQHLHPEHYAIRVEFCEHIDVSLEWKGELLHNVRIWGTENPHASVQHVQDLPKLNVFYAISKQRCTSPFFLIENTMTDLSYLDMLELWIFPQIREDSANFVSQQDGAPPHWHTEMYHNLNDKLARHWIGRCGRDDLFMCHHCQQHCMSSKTALPQLSWPSTGTCCNVYGVNSTTDWMCHL
ncbi:hypothetical protein PR048_017186 [Dryococelus australis]|uniref:Uncharacterized protein n=1 Tax=Dryococelus australis TaxID=614101 RepID=A0ABQ9H8Z9_9NEOP|nr:hypothetical protein PR048_017186 [Dryococelus australis]